MLHAYFGFGLWKESPSHTNTSTTEATLIGYGKVMKLLCNHFLSNCFERKIKEKKKILTKSTCKTCKKKKGTTLLLET